MEKIGKYLIREHIASGGMAEIYRGSLEGPHGFVKDVVIKAIHPHLSKDEKYIKLFLREAKLCSGLNHSNIVQVYEFLEESGRYYLVMEYVKGVDLVKVIRRSREKGIPIGIPRTIRIFQSVLSALDYAHNYINEAENILGIIHRDISPQNILISINGDVKITDFGIAKAAYSSGFTSQGAIVGKIDYMSPEQAFAREVNFTTDIFSTGIVLWETLTENKLFFADTDIELLEKVRRCEIIRPSAINPEVDEQFERIIMKALQTDPSFRYQKASEFANALGQYLKEYPHSIEEENLSDYMKALFPEFLQEHSHKTQILEEDDGEKTHNKGRKRAIIIFVSIFVVLLFLFGVLFMPRSQENISLIHDVNIIPITDLADINSFPDKDIKKSNDIIVVMEDTLPEKSDEDGEELKIDIQSTKADKKKKTPLNQRAEQVSDQKSVRTGRLSINAIPWADIYIGKKKIGTTPIFNYEIRSGSVEVIYKNDVLGVERKKKIKIEPDIENKYTEDLTK